jgi:hypothetical protein
VLRQGGRKCEAAECSEDSRGMHVSGGSKSTKKM